MKTYLLHTDGTIEWNRSTVLCASYVICHVVSTITALNAAEQLRYYCNTYNLWMSTTNMCIIILLGCSCDRMSSVCPSVTVNCDHIGWNSSEITSPSVSLGCSLFATPTWRVCSKGNNPKFGSKVTHPLLIWASETFDRKLRPNGYI